VVNVAATFRRLGKIEQAMGAINIQEAEVRDENNPAVWVQVCLPSLLYIHQLAIKSTSQTPCTNIPLNWLMGIPALDTGDDQSLVSVMTSDMPCDSVT
jgi:hypothetical protein